MARTPSVGYRPNPVSNLMIVRTLAVMTKVASIMVLRNIHFVTGIHVRVSIPRM